MIKKLLHNLVSLIGVILFTAALWVLHHELRHYHYRDIVFHLREIPFSHLFLAIVLTILNYLVLTGFDILAFQYIQKPLAIGRIIFTSFIGYAFSINIGQSVFSGGTVRYRLYSAWGLSAVDITKIIAFCFFSSIIGILTFGGVVFVIQPLPVPSSLHLPLSTVRPLGILFLVGVTIFIMFSILGRRELKIKDWVFPIPSVKLSFAQIGLAAVDWTLAGIILYLLLPSAYPLSFFYFLGVFLMAVIAGQVSQVPGGLGVFETILLLMISSKIPAASILGSLLVFRAIYYLLPLGVAVTLLGIHEALRKKDAVKKVTKALGDMLPVIIPRLLAITTFICGVILLVSGATPSVHGRMDLLMDFLPLPVIEISHFLGSIAGVGLLLLARGLQRRLDASFHFTIVLLCGGIIFSLFKGFDYEEATILFLMLSALLPCRHYFYRKAYLINQRYSIGWLSALFMVLAGSIWLGIFSHKHVEYSRELWWRFTLFGDAPRFLRATAGVVIFLFVFSFFRLLRAATPKPDIPKEEEIGKALSIISKVPETSANLVLLGDKSLLFSENEKAFIMYGVAGRSWVVMGDPIGEKKEHPELIWRFREICDQYDGCPVFYEVGPENIPLYLQTGLTLVKLGEEAWVPLEGFSLEGGGRKGFRHAINRLEKEGCVFEVISRDAVPGLLPDIKAISDAWIEMKHMREKGFSLGFFKESYLRYFPLATVRQQGRIIAFSNIWLGANKEEISIDLMRYSPGAPNGVMEYLFIKLMLWAKEQGYKRFNLGMAPLSGLEVRTLAPIWNRIGTFIFKHGEHFYNFKGLRAYKEKFDPQWQPRYLVSPGGFHLVRIFSDIAALVSGGYKGIISK